MNEAIANRDKTHDKVLAGVTWEDCTPIEPTSDCRIFTLEFERYVAYCVTEEMVGSCGKYEDEEYEGRLLRIYSKSHFLDFIARDTGGHFEEYRHYKIACLNHIIDIVSNKPPRLLVHYRGEAASQLLN